MEVFMVLSEYYKLNNGMRVPKVALGTWQVPDKVAVEAVSVAIDAGFKHIDTAVAYGNEEGVGAGLRAGMEKTGVRREALFVTTKIPAEIKSFKEAERCILESMKRLDCSYIDMMLIHAPRPWKEMNASSRYRYFDENLAVWEAMEDAYLAGKIRALGVSNFDIDDLKNIFDNGKVFPAVNQVKVHIGHVPMDIIEFCEQNGVLVEAYSPNATGKLKDVPEICGMAQKYRVSVPQLASRFDLQLGLLPLPKSANPDRIRENSNLDFEITAADMAQMLQIEGL